jgi:hypothetical protein
MWQRITTALGPQPTKREVCPAESGVLVGLGTVSRSKMRRTLLWMGLKGSEGEVERAGEDILRTVV